MQRAREATLKGESLGDKLKKETGGSAAAWLARSKDETKRNEERMKAEAKARELEELEKSAQVQILLHWDGLPRCSYTSICVYLLYFIVFCS